MRKIRSSFSFDRLCRIGWALYLSCGTTRLSLSCFDLLKTCLNLYENLHKISSFQAVKTCGCMPSHLENSTFNDLEVWSDSVVHAAG